MACLPTSTLRWPPGDRVEGDFLLAKVDADGGFELGAEGVVAVGHFHDRADNVEK
jgi:hypothetical protein